MSANPWDYLTHEEIVELAQREVRRLDRIPLEQRKDAENNQLWMWRNWLTGRPA